MKYFTVRGEERCLNAATRSVLCGSFITLSDGVPHYRLSGPQCGELVVLGGIAPSHPAGLGAIRSRDIDRQTGRRTNPLQAAAVSRYGVWLVPVERPQALVEHITAFIGTPKKRNAL